ncbi:MAG: hypothetical protein L7F77_01675 [Candidatus Magnetominusculus sp. LBB02]|nr:hypothetical protein [Candidatus Magnetominusculus sp. LBB02]
MSAAVLSKITAPDLDGVIERELCFKLIDKSLQKRVVWVSAPGGSGKTALAASYLKNRGNPFIWYHMDETDIDAATFFYYMSLAVSNLPGKRIDLPEFSPEYFDNVHGFAARYFKELFAGLNKKNGSRAPFLIVFDNYQNLPMESIVHDIIVRGLLPLMPEGFKVIVISRGEPTIEYVDIRRGDGLSLIEWNDLLFSLDDTLQLLKVSSKPKVPEDQIRQIHKQMDGWAAGLIMAIERTDIASSIPRFENVSGNEAVFDYFASEILEQTEPIERECLLKTAYLKEFTLPMAVQLTGCDQTHNILSRKHRNISINPDYCWVDIWALQEIMDEFRQAIAAPDGEKNIYELYRKALSVYKGSFLKSDQEQLWAVHRAEKLKDDFVNLCCKAGTFFEGISNWEKGIECYKSAIEADNLREECYRRTMTFYQKAGMKAEAVNLYNKCKQVFETQLGVSPSPQTEKLFKAITENK